MRAGGIWRFIRRLTAAAAIWAAMLSGADAQSPTGANTASVQSPIHQATANPSPGTCDTENPAARLGPPSAYVVQLDPDTLWRPRGSEVRFTLGSTTGTPPRIKRISVCFRWQLADSNTDVVQSGYRTSPLVRSVPNTQGMIGYGAVVPGLPEASHRGSEPNHVGAVAYTALYTVPVADMLVLVELEDATSFAVVLPVGITNVPSALAILAASLLAALAVLWCTASAELLAGASGWNLRNVSRHVLAVISTSNGVASLSQFQIMLWTLVVGGSAIYVMALSGNLIAISTGTLALLGIASATTVLARVPATGGAPAAVDPAAAVNPAVPPGPAAPAPAAPQPAGIPQWRQILVDDAGNPEIDVTRVQMLVFTLISAAFVAIKVAVSYSIPEIPDNFLLLMGISNGVYLAGRHIPSTPKGKTA